MAQRRIGCGGRNLCSRTYLAVTLVGGRALKRSWGGDDGVRSHVDPHTMLVRFPLGSDLLLLRLRYFCVLSESPAGKQKATYWSSMFFWWPAPLSHLDVAPSLFFLYSIPLHKSPSPKSTKEAVTEATTATISVWWNHLLNSRLDIKTRYCGSAVCQAGRF